MKHLSKLATALMVLGSMAVQADPLATWFEDFSGCDNANAPCFEAPGITAGSLTGNVPENQTSGYVPPDGNNLWSLRNHNWLDNTPAVFQVVMTANWIVDLASIDLTVFNNDCQRSHVPISGCVSATWGVQTSVNGGPFGGVLATFGGTAGESNGVHTSVSVALNQTLNAGDFITFRVSAQNPGNAYSTYGLYTGQYHFYDIRVNGTTVQPVTIDIKPGSETNSINISSSGVIPVAILGAVDFDVADIDPESVSLAGASVKLVGKSEKYLCHQEDVNLDGFTDLVCQVYTAQFFVEEGETMAILEAETFDGTKLRGEDVIRIVPDN